MLSLIISSPGGTILKRLAAAVTLVVGATIVISAGGQPPAGVLQAQLKQLFPSATAFSPKGGDPPHFKAFTGPAASQTVIGYAFWTTELSPLERGYGGPIPILVGIDPKGVLTGIIVADHHEPYGDFSIDRPAFAAEFKGKDVRDPFRLGTDIDAVSRATITMSSAVRAIRNSSRAVARALIAPPPAKP